MTQKRKNRCSRNKEERTLLWATATMGAVQLPDARLSQRAVAILAAKAARPGDCIAQGNPRSASVKATYRFLENPRVKPEPLWRAVHEHTAQGLPKLARIVSVQDTTCLMFPRLKCTKGLGTADQPREEALWMHSALALRPDGHVLGLLHNYVWARPLAEFGKGHQAKKRPFEAKESFEWVRGLRHTAELRDAFSPTTSVLTVCDSASDVHEVLAEATARPGDDAILRASQDRRVADDYASVRAQVAAQKALERLKIDVPRKQGERKRRARIEIRAVRATLLPPQNSHGLHPVPIHVLWVHEPRPPKGVEALDWLLLTTLPIGTAAERAEIVRLYKLRWRVEEFHLALKSGCHIEKTQLKTAERIKLLLPFFCATAARLVQLTYWARTEPNAACTVALSELEWTVAWRFTHRAPVPAGLATPTIAEAVRMIGRMGGHLGRKGDGMPGVRTLWKGWRDLQLLVDYHQTFG
ncbi:MAG TPA: IS4 family transposase [Planctomycetota bacterium]|nr:IS4 family transposase [Planctomycetota bacterium]